MSAITPLLPPFFRHMTPRHAAFIFHFHVYDYFHARSMRFSPLLCAMIDAGAAAADFRCCRFSRRYRRRVSFSQLFIIIFLLFHIGEHDFSMMILPSDIMLFPLYIQHMRMVAAAARCFFARRHIHMPCHATTRAMPCARFSHAFYYLTVLQHKKRFRHYYASCCFSLHSAIL